MTEPPAFAGFRALTREEVRQVDLTAWTEFGLPGVVLMENAGRGAARILLTRHLRGPVLVCAGKGNNGGDAFVVARYLDLAGIPVELLTCVPAELQSADSSVFRRAVERSGLVCHSWPTADLSGGDVDGVRSPAASTAPPRDTLDFARFDWIVDGLIGTGARGAPAPELAALIYALNASGRPLFALDLPSGLDCDSGATPGACIRATLTATFVAPKIGFDSTNAAQWLGEIEVVDIGLPRALRDRLLQLKETQRAVFRG